MLTGRKLLTALDEVELTGAHGPWSRIIAYKHMLAVGGRKPQPLWARGPSLNGARFTPKGGADSIYLAADPVTALLEVEGVVSIGGTLQPVRSLPRVILTVEGVVSNVLDLTNEGTLDALGTNKQEMTGSWLILDEPPTHTLGNVAYAYNRISGIKYNSTRPQAKENLVIFANRLKGTDFLRIFDPDGCLTQEIRA